MMFVEYTGKPSMAPALALLTAGVRGQLIHKKDHSSSVRHPDGDMLQLNHFNNLV